jgi:hypothetical protein
MIHKNHYLNYADATTNEASGLDNHQRLKVRSLIRSGCELRHITAAVQGATHHDVRAEASEQLEQVQSDLDAALTWGPDREDESYRVPRLLERRAKLAALLGRPTDAAGDELHALRVAIRTMPPRHLPRLPARLAGRSSESCGRFYLRIATAVAEILPQLTSARLLAHPASTDHRRAQVQLDSLHQLREFAGRDDFLSARITALTDAQADARSRAAEEVAAWTAELMRRLEQRDLTALAEVAGELEQHPSHYPAGTAGSLRDAIARALADRD